MAAVAWYAIEEFSTAAAFVGPPAVGAFYVYYYWPSLSWFGITVTAISTVVVWIKLSRFFADMSRSLPLESSDAGAPGDPGAPTTGDEE
jgi:hypothetical protein